jgi:hypothetical protein
MIGKYRRHIAFRILGLAALTGFLTTVVPGGLWIPSALAAESPDLAPAREHYDFAEFQPALDICNTLIGGGTLAGDALRDAYVLKARCLVNLGNHSIARDMFCEALRLDAGWRPEASLLPREEQVDFDQALAGCRFDTAPQASPTPASPQAPAPAPAPKPTWKPTPIPAAKGGKSFFAKPLGIALIVAVAGGLAVSLSGGGGDGGGGGGDPTPSDPLPGFPLPPVSAGR